MLTVLNDLHLGVNRKTPFLKELHDYAQQSLAHLLYDIDSDLLVNGDLFDEFDPPAHVLLDTYFQFSSWLDKGHRLYLSAGNHDYSKDSTKMSGISLLAKLLEKLHPDTVVYINEPTMTPHGLVIPHMKNQEEFNSALECVAKCGVVFIHANYDNKFAVQSDHSLNVSEEQAKALPCDLIVFGHEHQAKTALGGKVVITGNQICTSVADCLGNATKQYAVIDGTDVTFKEVTKIADIYTQVDWKSKVIPSVQFLRISGKATAEEAAEVVATVANIRAGSAAFVVTNAVEIAQSSDEFSLTDSVEKLGSFDVMEALKEFLTEPEMKKVSNL